MTVGSSINAAPEQVKRIFALVLAYVGFVLASTLWFAFQSEVVDMGELVRGLLRVLGMSALAYWLLGMSKPAWWVSVVVCGVLSVIGIAALVMLGIVGVMYGKPVMVNLLVLVIPAFLLSYATVLLLKRDTRVLFGGPLEK